MTPYFDAIKWWELRRILFNIAVGICGIISIAVIEWIGGLHVAPGEDVIEPPFMIVCIVVYGIAANAFYTLGWITEVLWSRGDVERTRPIRFWVFCAGTVFSCLVTLIPAVFFPAAWALMGFK